MKSNGGVERRRGKEKKHHGPGSATGLKEISGPERLAGIFNSFRNIMVFSLDRQYCYTGFNESHFSEMRRVWDVDIAIGTNMLNCMHSSDLRQLAKYSMDRALSGESFTEVQHQPDLGNYYELSWSPVFHQQEIVGVSALIRDITDRKMSELELEQFSIFFKKSLDLKIIIDSNGLIRKHNPACTNSLGFGASEILSKRFVDFVNPQEKQSTVDGLQRLSSKTGTITLENRLICKDGFAKWFFWNLNYFSDEGVVFASGHEIEDQRKVSIELVRVNRVYAIISKINDLVLRSKDADQMFWEICTLTIQMGGYRMCWMGLVDDVTKTVRPVAWAGAEEGYLTQGIPVSLEDVPAGQGPTGRSVREGKVIVCQDYSSDPTIRPWRQEALKRGYYSSISLPVRVGNKVTGTLNLYAGEVNHFSIESELDLLDKIVENISFSLEGIQRSGEQRDSQQKIRESESRYRMLADNSLDVIWTIDLTGKFTYVSPSIFHLLGLLPEEVLSKSINEMVAPGRSTEIALDHLKSQMSRAEEGGQLPEELFDVELRCKDGSLVWTETISRILYDNDSGIGIIGITRNIRERRKNMERMLQLSEAVKQSPVSIVITDLDAKIQYVNPKCAVLTGYGLEELIGKNPRVLQSGETAPGVYRELWENLTAGRKWHGEFHNRKKNGELYWESATLSPIIDERGEISSYLAVKEDITEKKKMEEELVRQKQFFEQMFMQSSMSTQILDREGWCTKINPKLCELFGVSASNMEGHVYNIFKDEAIKQAGIIPLLESVFREGKHVTWETEFDIGMAAASQHIDVTRNEKVWFQNWAYPILDMDGRVAHVIIQHVDIVDRKRAEADLKSSILKIAANEKQFRTLIEHNYDGITLFNQHWVNTFQSPSVHKITGYTPEDRIHKSIYTLLHPDDVEPTRVLLAKVLASPNKLIEFSYRVRHKKGHYIWLEGMFNNLLHDPHVSAVICNYRDITDRKVIEDEIRILNQDLELRVVRRTEELAVVNKELDGFTYSVSHDLRAPLRIIDGFSQILLEDYAEKLDEEGQKYLRTIMNSVKRMGKLIDDLLDFSHLGRKELRRSQVNMETLIQEVLQELKIEGIKLPDDISVGSLVPDICDSSLLKQLWTNLISNAIKYSSKTEHPRIEIGMRKDGSGPVYYIKDNGAGFDMKYYGKLFGVFQRLHKNTDFPGTGVGLALAQRIIARHGGTIWAVAKPDQGATFYFTLQDSESDLIKAMIQKDQMRNLSRPVPIIRQEWDRWKLKP